MKRQAIVMGGEVRKAKITWGANLPRGIAMSPIDHNTLMTLLLMGFDISGGKLQGTYTVYDDDEGRHFIQTTPRTVK